VVSAAPDDYVFVDTTVLIYAHGVDSADASAQRARAVLAALWQADRGVLSTQVLQEFYAVATRKPRPPMAKRQARAMVASYHDWCSVNTDTGLTVSASKLDEDHTIAFWDALIIEAALRAGGDPAAVRGSPARAPVRPVVGREPVPGSRIR
jgi:predicted nucleic acid-binding protein